VTTGYSGRPDDVRVGVASRIGSGKNAGGSGALTPAGVGFVQIAM